jgi:hypothetical protein
LSNALTTLKINYQLCDSSYAGGAMPIEFDTAHLTVKLRSKEHSMADVGLVVEAMENMVIASVWGAMLDVEPQDETVVKAKSILMESIGRNKAGARFFPGFYDGRLFRSQASVSESNDQREFDTHELDGFDPYDPLDAGVQIGMDSWFRRTIYSRDLDLYRQLFSFGRVQRLEHHSPLLIELAVVFGLGVIVPVALVYGLMTAIHRARRSAAEADIRETEADLKKEELKQQRQKTKIIADIADGVHELSVRHQLEIPKEVLVQTAQLGAPSVADLGSSPLIGEVSIGLSAGK